MLLFTDVKKERDYEKCHDYWIAIWVFPYFWVSVWLHEAKPRNFTRIKIHMGTW